MSASELELPTMKTGCQHFGTKEARGGGSTSDVSPVESRFAYSFCRCSRSSRCRLSSASLAFLARISSLRCIFYVGYLLGGVVVRNRAIMISLIPLNEA